MDRTIRLVLAGAALLTSLACGITVNLPVDEIATGPTETMPISVDYPATEPASLKLNFGAGELALRPGPGEKLVEGNASYNIADFEPVIDVGVSQANISTGDLEINGIPKMSGKVENKWDLQLGSRPLALEILAGAYSGNFELGGLKLNSLSVTDGAADVRLRFSTPNPVEMEHLRYQTGASNVSIYGLANANFKSMIFRAGAGEYLLDFSGTLKQDAVVTIETGLSQVVIAVPEGVPAKVITAGELMDVQTEGGWEKQENGYGLSGTGPTLTITLDMGAGSLQLKSLK